MFSMPSYADDSQEVKRIKCYVELVGGGQKIHTIISTNKEDSPNSLKHELVGWKIYDDKGGKSKIYKVFECAYQADSFKSNKARQLEENQAK